MNLNHDPDKHLLDQIDKRLTSPHPVGDTVIDELAATQPRPREAFQQALEARLLARVETLREGETHMTTNTAYLPVESRRRSLLPLTLLAAMLVVVVAGGLLLSGGRLPTSEVSLAQPSASATPTRVIVTVVPITASNLGVDRTAIEIPRDLLTADSLTPEVGGLVDIVALLPFTSNQPNIDGVPATALPDGTRLIEKFVAFGAAALTAGEQTESVVFSVPPDEGRLLAWLVEQGITLRLQAPMSSGIQHLGDRRVIDIPIENLTAAESIQVGDTVDVYSTCSFVAVLGVVQTLDCDQSLEEKQTDGVVIFGEWAADGQAQGNTESIGLAVLPDVYTHIAGLTAAGMQFKLVKSLDTQSVVPPFTPTPMLVPPGKVAIAVPMASLTETEGEGLNVGDNVDVIVTYKMVEVSDAPGEFQQMMTPEPGEIAQLTQRMMKGAVIVGMSDTPVQTIILAVTPQEAVIFEWVLEAKLPITLRPYPASADPNADSSPYTLQLPLDSLSRWAADDIQVGDSVDLVMGFVLGNTDTVSLDFKRYGTHTWGDPLSDGSISAQIYAPLNEQAGGGSGFMLRVLHGAVVTAMQVNTDPVSGRMSDAKVTLEMPAGTRATSVEALKGYVEAGIPYLLVTR